MAGLALILWVKFVQGGCGPTQMAVKVQPWEATLWTQIASWIPVWQNCGFYGRPIPNETAVHSLEHGAVWITYRPDLSADQVDMLRRLARSQTFVLVSPFPELPSPVVASAWGRQLQLESARPGRYRVTVEVKSGTETVRRTTTLAIDPDLKAPDAGG